MIRFYSLFCLIFLHLACCSYVPVEMPNGSTLPWKMEDGVKVFHLTAEPVKKEFAPGMIVNCWGYNGQCPGPLIEAVEGDKVRILVTNRLPESTTVHWHGILTPNGMDGVSGLNQPPIEPGQTAKYEFTLHQNGTYMYHSHYDEMIQIGMGLAGIFVIHPKVEENPTIDRDFAIMLNEWFIPPGASTPDPNVMVDFNYFTLNGCVYPGSAPLVVRKGQKTRIRFVNVSMNSHPMHLHGYVFAVTGGSAGRYPTSLQYKESTIDVPVGSMRDIEFAADVEGDWALHCHKTHHLMNGMTHAISNMIGVDQSQIESKIEKIIPGYMAMGESGMGEMFSGHYHHMKRPPNTLPFGSPGPFGTIDMGGMFTILKVREGITSYADPGWYIQPTDSRLQIE